jgi:hypothetical protein
MYSGSYIVKYFLNQNNLKMPRKIVLFIMLIAFLLTVYLVFSGAEILYKPFINAVGMPFGTLISWIGIIAFPFSIYFACTHINNPKTRFSKNYQTVLKILIILACLWGIVGYYLADNWAFNFSSKKVFRGGEKAAIYFWNYTYTIVILPLLFVIVYWLHSGIKKLNKNRKLK